MLLDHRHPRFTYAAILAVACALPLAASAEETNDGPRKLVALTFPLSEGLEATTARALIPQGHPSLYQLISIDRLTSRERTKRSEQIRQETQNIAEGAREAALAFHLDEAAQILRRASDALLMSDAVALSPSLVSSFLLEAGSASAQAGDNDYALLYFRKAIAIDAGIRPGPTLPPETLEIFERARKLGPSLLQIPARQVLVELSRLLNVDGVLWISAGTDDQGFQVAEKIILIERAESEPEIRHHPSVEANALDRWITSERQRIHQIILLQLPPTPVEHKVTAKKPWYKKWWVYAVAGGVLAAGGAVTGIVLGTQRDPARVDVVVYH